MKISKLQIKNFIGKAREEFLRQIADDDYQYFLTEAAPCEVEISKVG